MGCRTKKILKIDDCYKDKRFNKDFDKTTGFKTRNMICAPMIRKKDLIGVIQVINKKEDRLFDQQDVDLFTVLASECALAIENARLAEVEIKTEQLNYELKIAHQIQQKLLPSKLPDFTDFDVSAELIPAKEVGGDYYNVIYLLWVSYPQLSIYNRLLSIFLHTFLCLDFQNKV